MKNLLVLFLFLPTFLFSSYGQTEEYHLVWQDTFDGGKLDESLWTIEVNGDGGGNNELQYYRRENVSVGVEPVSGKNCLILTARKESFSGKTCTSGRLRTVGKMEFKYGKLEGRIKLPKTANGLWPAFWMMGGDYPQVGWPKCGEIDILEMGNVNGINRGTQERYFSGWFHWGESWNGGSYPNWGRDKTADYSLQDDFHLYTVEWDDNSIKMYLDQDQYPDAAPYVEMNINKSDGTGAGQVGRYFHKPFYVILNLAIGGNFTGITGNANIDRITAFDKVDDKEPKMYIDYLKLYQKGVDGEEYHGPELSSAIETMIYSMFKVSYTAGGTLTVEGDLIPAKISLYNPAGQKIQEVTNTNSTHVLVLQDGMYILKIQTHSGYEEAHKLAINY